jgi:CHAT domain-containing protein
MRPLIPLHALPLPNESDRYWMDILSRGIRYAPSCQLLQLTKHHASNALTRLFAIQDSMQDLSLANSVVAGARQYFEANGSRSNDIKILIGENATKQAFDTANDSGDLESMQCLLFSGHGSFCEKFPLQSKLMLAEGTSLTLSDIFSLRLRECRLVVLSACETGLIDRTSMSDEYVGLPSGFLFAGSPSIVGSLWKVPSISTTLLIREFYKNIFNIIRLNQDFHEGDVAKALCLAQKWLRQASTEECEAALKEIGIQARSEYPSLPRGKQDLYEAFLDRAHKQVTQTTYPFSNPYYWAAFTAIGF